MNERIFELAEQAGFKLIRENCYDVVSTMSVQEFAELIVRDCLVQIAEAIPDTNCSASGAYQTAKIVVTCRVKHHFGVKE